MTENTRQHLPSIKAIILSTITILFTIFGGIYWAGEKIATANGNSKEALSISKIALDNGTSLEQKHEEDCKTNVSQHDKIEAENNIKFNTIINGLWDLGIKIQQIQTLNAPSPLERRLSSPILDSMKSCILPIKIDSFACCPDSLFYDSSVVQNKTNN